MSFEVGGLRIFCDEDLNWVSLKFVYKWNTNFSTLEIILSLISRSSNT